MQRAQIWSAVAVRPSSGLALRPPFRYTTLEHSCRRASSIPTIRQTRAKPKSSTVRIPRSRAEEARRRKEGLADDLHDDSQLINTQSLAETLQAHREANQESVVIKNYLSEAPAGQSPRSPIESDSIHLELERSDSGSGPREEYDGKPRPLALDWALLGNVPRYMRWPWLEQLDQLGRSRDSAKTRISQEIRAADAYFTPTLEEARAVDRAHKDVEAFVMRANTPITRVDIIGSRASGLATPLSDLDFNIVFQDGSDTAGVSAGSAPLDNIYRFMRQSRRAPPEVSISYFARAARVPIVVGVHAPTGLEFQMQSASSGYGSMELAKCLSAEHPTLTGLFRILKHALKMHGLTEGRHGGITSYPLLNMITTSLKLSEEDIEIFDIASHLLHFLEFWAKFDTYNTGIMQVPSKHLASGSEPYRDGKTALATIDLVTQDPIGARPFPFNVKQPLSLIHEKKDDYMLTLHDPANPYNDLGRSAYLIKHVQATFLDMHNKLKDDLSTWDRQIRAEGQAAERPPALLRSLLQGDYSMYQLERKRLRSYASTSAKSDI